MAHAQFRIIRNQSPGVCHLTLLGDLDADGAQTLVTTLLELGRDVNQVIINTSCLRSVDEHAARQISDQFKRRPGLLDPVFFVGRNTDKIGAPGRNFF